MKESLTPGKIQKRLSTGDLSKEKAVEQLISLIEGSDDTEIRVQSIETLEKLKVQSETIFEMLENCLISDENAIVRSTVAKYIIEHYLEEGISALTWTIKHEKSPFIIKFFFSSMEKFDSPNLKPIKKAMTNWNEKFSSKIGVTPKESSFFLDLELLFCKDKSRYEIDPMSYKHYETLSDTKNGEPWLVIKNKHVVTLNFNYFNWKFIKNNMDIIDSLSKLQNLDIYLSSLHKYNMNDTTILYIPESIGSLTHLSKLILRRNGLEILPLSLRKLSLIKELDLSHNKLKEIPDFFLSFNFLEKLNIKHNIVKDIPRQLSNTTTVIR